MLASVRNYRVVRPLGTGGMGEVYLAQDTRLDRPVALKFLPAESGADARHRQRFLTEAKAVAALNHPNICTIYDVGEAEDGRPFIAMELLEGETLGVRLKRGSLEMPELIRIGLQIVEALAAAHAKGIVHRDIKPSNLHVTAEGRVKVLDFGLAKRLTVEAGEEETATRLRTQSGQVLGTPDYMSPEQALGKEVDARTDLFSLGVVLYEMVTGRRPFAGRSLSETLEKILHGTPEALARFNYAVPAELERVILKCLRKAPEERYQSARDLAVDLRHLQESLRAPETGKMAVVAPAWAATGQVVTLLFVSTNGEELERSLGAGEAAQLLRAHQSSLDQRLKALTQAALVESAGNTMLLSFARPSSAVQFGLETQLATPKPLACRMGIHLGEVVKAQAENAHEQLGEQLVLCERLLQLARPGQILMSRAVFDSARQVVRAELVEGLGQLSWLNHGPYVLEGIDGAVEICETTAAGQKAGGPPTTSAKAQRQVTPGEEQVPGWRPALDQLVPNTRWVLEQKLGEGGFGEVWLGRHQTMKERRVFKFCFRADRVRSLKREMTLFRLLKERIGDHPNIVALRDVYFDEPPFYVEMDYVAGQDLRTWSEAQGGIEKVPLDVRLEIVAQVADAMQAAHDSGVIHRDIKPGNILIGNPKFEIRNPKLEVKLTDFGIGQVVSEEYLKGITRAGFTQTMVSPGSSSQTGTQLYMAPELLAGKPASTRSDIYSLGVVLYQLLVGDLKSPLTTDWQNEVADPLLRDDLKHCFAGHPEDRFATAGELAKNLRTLPERRATLTQQQAVLLKREQMVRRWRLLRAAALAVVIVVLGFTVVRFYFRTAKVRWAREQALPQATRLADAEKFSEAFELALQAERHIPKDDPALTNLLARVSVRVSIETVPPGADVYAREYRMATTNWPHLGKTPIIGLRMPHGLYRWQIHKPGYAVIEQAFEGAAGTSMNRFTLDEESAIPPGMVRVTETNSYMRLTGLDHLESVTVGDYLIDKYEVSNRQFQDFVNRSGYSKTNYWKQPFIKGGKALSWKEAITLFKDRTGQPGPATWANAKFAEGRGNFPVTGVSWYEAAAYCEFAGKSLPTIFHWNTAASIRFASSIIPLSNFGGQGPAPAGAYRGLSGSGTYDMAGNVKEWCWNESGSGKRYILGGAWLEPNYMFNVPDAQSPFERFETYGFRCVKALGSTLISAAAADAVPAAFRDYASEKPVPDEIFRVFRNSFSYDKTDLNAAVEAVDDTSDSWRMEKVRFNAAYGSEQVIAYVFLPKKSAPPYQTIMYFPGANAIVQRSSEARFLPLQYIDFIVQSGRAVMYPVYKGTYERGDGLNSNRPKPTTFYRDHVIAWSKDLGRAIDYLQTRKDIQPDKFGYFGGSWGGGLGAILPAVEPRLKVNVLFIGGLWMEKTLPEVDQINFAPRVTTPTLMLSGRYDFVFPVESSQVPMFRLLGTPDKDKRRVVYDTGHAIPWSELIKETLAWFDRYLGPVK